MNDHDKKILIQDIPEAKVIIKDNLVFINTQEYIVIDNYKNALNEKSLEDRYTQLLQKYDYIVGDWGHEQLRLKGFFEDSNTSVDMDRRISTLEDYLREYCAFGCSYFVLKINGKPIPFIPEPSKKARRRPQKKYYDKSMIIHTQKPTENKPCHHQKRRINKTKNVHHTNDNTLQSHKKNKNINNKKHSFVIRTKGER